jgi:hypothetical protein
VRHGAARAVGENGEMSDSNGNQDAPRRIGVVPFDRSMIRDHLDRHDLKYLVDQDGDFRVDFATDHGFTISALLLAEGTNADIFVLNVMCTQLVPKTLWPKAIYFCNRWNTETRYPKAYLQVPADIEELFAGIHLEGQFPMSAGTTQAIVDEIINVIIGTGISFWERVVAEQVLIDDPDDEIGND